jgi:serine/threonine protein kinase
VGIPRWPPQKFPWDIPCSGPVEFRLIRRLGAGSQGEVYDAQYMLRRGERRAIKFFQPRLRDALRPEDIQLLLQTFKEEAEYGLEHRSPHLAHTLRLLDLRPYAAAGWPPFGLVMKYFDTTLDKVLRHCRDHSVKLPLDTG